jgi:hypothetical protein
MRGLKMLLLMGCLCALVCLSSAQWPSWIEVRVEHKEASARIASPGRAMLCDGGNVTIVVDIEGGSGPWQVVMHRDGEFFARLKVSDADSWSNIMRRPSVRSVSAQTSLPGTYTLSRVCDANYCNGTVANTSLAVELASPPTARIEPPCKAICVGSKGAPNTHQVIVRGRAPLTVHFSLVGSETVGFSTVISSEGAHPLSKQASCCPPSRSFDSHELHEHVSAPRSRSAIAAVCASRCHGSCALTSVGLICTGDLVSRIVGDHGAVPQRAMPGGDVDSHAHFYSCCAFRTARLPAPPLPAVLPLPLLP